MNITRKNLTNTHSIISVAITKADYQEKIDKKLNDYKKTAVIPGFRKGMIPMNLIHKQYGSTVKYEVVNKLVENNLDNYIKVEKLDLLGQPIPLFSNLLDLNEDDFTLEYEIGIAPIFDLNLSQIEATQYKIIADETMVNEQLDSIQKQFGTKIVKETFEDGNDVKGTITNEEKNINAVVDFNCNIFKNKEITTSLLGKKSGEIITFSSVDLFDNDHKIMDFLHIDHSITHGLDVVLSLEITDILEIQKADINQELFDKLFGEGKINSAEELKEKIKEDIEKQYVSHTDSQFLIALDKKLIESTKIDLPKEFLTKWIQFTSKSEISIEEAAQEFEKSENGLKFQLIEAKIINDNNLQLTFDELKDFTAAQIKQQMLMYGVQNLDDKMIDETTMRILSKREEVERQSNQLKEIKMLNFYKETVKTKVKEVNVDQFIKEINNE
jgi:trigger factor